MSSTYGDKASQKNLQVCEWKTMRYLSGTNGIHQEMEVAVETSVGIMPAESGTNKNCVSISRWMQVFGSTVFLEGNTPSAHSRFLLISKGKQEILNAIGGQSCLICSHASLVHVTIGSASVSWL